MRADMFVFFREHLYKIKPKFMHNYFILKKIQFFYSLAWLVIAGAFEFRPSVTIAIAIAVAIAVAIGQGRQVSF